MLRRPKSKLFLNFVAVNECLVSFKRTAKSGKLPFQKDRKNETVFLFLNRSKLFRQSLQLVVNRTVDNFPFDRAEKAASCLLPNTCLGIATRIIAKFETLEVGMTWDQVSRSPSPDDDFSFSWVLGMFAIQIAIYGILTWYVKVETADRQ